MGCKVGEVSDQNLKELKFLEDNLSYPPRFQLKFEYINAEKMVTEEKVIFNGVLNSPTFTITLKKNRLTQYDAHQLFI